MQGLGLNKREDEQRSDGATASSAASHSVAASPSIAAPQPSTTSTSSSRPVPLSSYPPWNESLRHFDRAASLAASNHLSDSLSTYDTGLQLLMALLKSLPKDEAHAQQRQELRQVIDRYMTKAEEVKRRRDKMGGKNGVVPATKPSASRIAQSKRPLRNASSAASSSVSTAAAAASSAVAAPRPGDPHLRAAIESEILTGAPRVTFDDIVGLETVKEALREMVILPALRPDLFSGVRAPPKGLLMFGPPGNGKTLIAKACASECRATFFSISAASLMSKHLGEGEKLVRTLFTVAREKAPSLIFLDEIDSLMGRRGDGEHEASRRLKTELLIALDGLSSNSSENGNARVMVIAATNLPESLDDAFMRRMTRRIYVPLPDAAARRTLLVKLLSGPSILHALSDADMDDLVSHTAGYSNSDLTALVADAAMGPLRGLSAHQILHTPADQLPPISMKHFHTALTKIRPSVSKQRLEAYDKWQKQQESAR